MTCKHEGSKTTFLARFNTPFFANFRAMKNYKSVFAYLLLVFMFASAQLVAQDDLYYDPATGSGGSTTTNYYEESNSNQREPGNYTAVADDEYYNYDEDNAYEYSSRIRRFDRGYRGFSYYDPFYSDAWFYDPFLSPGASIYVVNYNDYWSWRSWNRHNRHNRYNYFSYGPSFGYNSWCGWNSYNYNPWNSWGNTYVYNNYYYDPYWSWNGYNPYYCPVNYGHSNYYHNNNHYDNGGSSNGYTPNTYTGVRRGGTVVNPGRTISEPKSGRVIKSDIEPNYERKADKTNGRIDTPAPATPKARGNDVEVAPAPRVEKAPVRVSDEPVRKPRETEVKRDPNTSTEPVRKPRETEVVREPNTTREPIRAEQPTRTPRTEKQADPVRQEPTRTIEKVKAPVRNAPEPTRSPKTDRSGGGNDNTFAPDRSSTRQIEKAESRQESRSERSTERSSPAPRQERSVERAPAPRQERSTPRTESAPARSESKTSGSNSKSSGGGRRGN